MSKLPATRTESIAYYRKCLADAATRDLKDVIEAQLAKSDLFYLLTVICGRVDMNHDWVFDRCREVQASPNGHLDLWARGHYKSSIITFGLSILDILNDPETTIGIFSFSRPIAKQFLFQIKAEFENNERLKRLFPGVLYANPRAESPRWSLDDGIIVKRQGNPKECTVEAWGLVDSQPTSKHFKTLVYDDVVTVESVTTPEMIAKVTARWEMSGNLGTEDANTRIIGTRYHYADTYRSIIERGAATVRKHTITVDGTMDGEPVMWTREQVIARRRRDGPYTFGSQMLLDPVADRSMGFLEEWLRYYQGKAEDNLNRYLLVDPASEKGKDSDYTAMAVIGLGSDENYYLLDAVRDRLSLKERGDAVFALHRRWRPKAVAYERYGMQADIDYLKIRMGEENYRFDITEVAGQVSKADRIRRMIPLFESGRFWLPETLLKVDYEGRHVDLVQTFVGEEYKPFPVGLHDDMFDAIARIWDIRTVWPKPIAIDDRYARQKQRRRSGGSYMAA